MTGIYCIENIINNKKYIGQSVNIEDRWRHHINELKRNEHDNKYLQRSYNKYGLDNFKFYILEQCNQKDLDDKEIYWITKLDTYKNGFNLTKGGSGIKNWTPSDEYKKKISKIVSGKNNPNYGHR
ncbi:GIY-YIG nuclease family protein [Eubacterium sp. BX4]|uniref:GIY-YIG nuclease family protein n=1 Tax=Eubacterium segne TaxID=2763045 RepID=A0ABR7F128_9FIRM|nr:GIY-YIG nuclease family protein [Eubacterium segne]